uniref:Uncharacterized protein n=1 Tax=viral metagenome TaxID=1070528 RepID=A0A6C0FAN2_9ZZZZ|tara:strand:+ start:572 stop:1513 length:942 start_codon:yes stop_codon:yes gene_type:complete
MTNSRITNLTKTEANGKCGKKCALTIHKSRNKEKHSFSIRWKKTEKGGVISINPLNYNKETEKALTLGIIPYSYSTPTRISFYKAIDLVINSKTPDCIVSIHLQSKRSVNDDLTVIIPFVTGEVITPGTEMISEIIDNIVNFQPNEGDEPTDIKGTSLLNLFPDNGSYYEAKEEDSKGKDKYIIIDTFQAIKTGDMQKIQKLFDLDNEEVTETIRAPGRKLNFFSYTRSENKIKEGMVNRNNKRGRGDDDIYIDCRPVGVDEETEQVTVSYDEKEAKRAGQVFIWIFIVVLLICGVLAMLFLLNYLMKKYVNS